MPCQSKLWWSANPMWCIGFKGPTRLRVSALAPAVTCKTDYILEWDQHALRGVSLRNARLVQIQLLSLFPSASSVTATICAHSKLSAWAQFSIPGYRYNKLYSILSVSVKLTVSYLSQYKQPTYSKQPTETRATKLWWKLKSLLNKSSSQTSSQLHLARSTWTRKVCLTTIVGTLIYPADHRSGSYTWN